MAGRARPGPRGDGTPGGEKPHRVQGAEWVGSRAAGAPERRVSHPVLEGKPNANYVRARIRTHVHSDYINEHHHTMLE
jgi:hypothetical protein